MKNFTLKDDRRNSPAYQLDRKRLLFIQEVRQKARERGDTETVTNCGTIISSLNKDLISRDYEVIDRLEQQINRMTELLKTQKLAKPLSREDRWKRAFQAIDEALGIKPETF